MQMLTLLSFSRSFGKFTLLIPDLKTGLTIHVRKLLKTHNLLSSISSSLWHST